MPNHNYTTVALHDAQFVARLIIDAQSLDGPAASVALDRALRWSNLLTESISLAISQNGDTPSTTTVHNG